MALSFFLSQISLGVQGIGRKIGGKRKGNNRYADNRPRREFSRFESQGFADNRRIDGRRRSGQSDHIDSTIKVVDKVVRGIVLSGDRMIKTDI
ncbi:hypothetical protein TNCV_2866561 [Trichonephila clavipes]|nr:hypothetical protein TNCV_2866561 [Trichonephila clavipes]